MLLPEINIAYYQRLMHDIREAISQGTFAAFHERTAGRMGKRRYRTSLMRHCRDTENEGET